MSVYAPYQAPTPTSEERNWALASHLGVTLGLVFSASALGWVLPLIAYLMKKDESRFVRTAAAGSLNFALNMLAWQVLGWMLTLVGIALFWLVFPVVFVFIGGLILVAGWVMQIIFPILAALAVNRGESYKYPFTLELVR